MKPIVGSSRTYKTPVKLVPIWEANLIRWASPDDRRRCSPQCQVFQADVEQKFQPDRKFSDNRKRHSQFLG